MPPDENDKKPDDKATPAAAEKTFTQAELGELLAKERERSKSTGAKSALDALIAKFKDAGISSEEDLETTVKFAAEAKKAAMSEAEKSAAHTKKLEAQLAQAKAEAAEAVADAAKARVIAAARPADTEAFEALYDKASKADGFDSEAWIAAQRTARAYLFEAAAAPAAAPATAPASKANAQAGARAPAAAPTAPGSKPAFNALTASKEEIAAFEASSGLQSRSPFFQENPQKTT
jgi:hypothetical protein